VQSTTLQRELQAQFEYFYQSAKEDLAVNEKPLKGRDRVAWRHGPGNKSLSARNLKGRNKYLDTPLLSEKEKGRLNTEGLFPHN